MKNAFSLPKGALILASESQTRKQLLINASVNFVTRAANIDEASLRDSAVASSVPAADIAVMLAEMKARKVAQENGKNHSGFVLGADQILICDGQILGKPEDIVTAYSQLRLLSGKKHQLITAAVICREGERIWHHLEIPTLTMRHLESDFIDQYLSAVGALAFESPGSYQVEGLGAHLFSRIEGCSYSVLGLPLLHVLVFLRSNGLTLRVQA